jgi:hypothetical protein
MDDATEQVWMDGNRAAWVAMLGECLKRLGYDTPEAMSVKWVKEREEAIAILRRLCREHGDNHWEPNLHLADIIDKHLGDHLGEE